MVRLRRKRKKVVEAQDETKTTKDIIVIPNDVVQTIEYNYSGVERINSTPKYRKTIRKGVIEDLIGKYVIYTADQLTEESQDPTIPILERQIMSMVATSLKTKTQIGSATMRYIHDRLEGKVKDVIEHSGPDGGAIAISHTQVGSEIDAFLNLLTDEELADYEDIAKDRAEFESSVRLRIKQNEQTCED